MEAITVTKWKTVDGMTFDSKAQAQLHEIELFISENFKTFRPADHDTLQSMALSRPELVLKVVVDVFEAQEKPLPSLPQTRKLTGQDAATFRLLVKDFDEACHENAFKGSLVSAGDRDTIVEVYESTLAALFDFFGLKP